MPVHPTVHAQLSLALKFASNLASTEENWVMDVISTWLWTTMYVHKYVHRLASGPPPPRTRPAAAAAGGETRETLGLGSPGVALGRRRERVRRRNLEHEEY